MDRPWRRSGAARRGGGRGQRGEPMPSLPTMSGPENWRLPPPRPSSDIRDPVVWKETDESHVVGTCERMCPAAEARERERNRELSRFEVSPDDPARSFPWAVKRYRRPAAGRVDLDPHELRPPAVLLATLDHLFERVLPWRGCGFDWSGDEGPTQVSQAEFLSLYHFLSDRLRSVRQDFIVQRVETSARRAALEQCARFYILSGLIANRQLHGAEHVDWSDTLNDQQLASALTELHALYRSVSDKEHDGKRMAEMLTYDIILHLHDPEAVSLLLLKAPRTILKDPIVRLAMTLYVAFQTEDYCSFFKRSSCLPALHRCLLMRHLPGIWTTGIHMMNKAFGKTDKFALVEVARVFGLPTALDARRLCAGLNVFIDEDTPAGGERTEALPNDSWEDHEGTLPFPAHVNIKSSNGFVRFKITKPTDAMEKTTSRRLLMNFADLLSKELSSISNATELVRFGHFAQSEIKT